MFAIFELGNNKPPRSRAVEVLIENIFSFEAELRGAEFTSSAKPI
jgi:hypothetical protein